MKNKLYIKIKELRLDKGMKQTDIAKVLGIAPTTYAGYEQGKSEPNLDTVIFLAQYFKVTTDYLLGLED